MKASLSWLKDYVGIENDIEVISEGLTMAGLEVEEVSNRYQYLDKVIVGRVLSVAPHPNADKLTLCTVSTGAEELMVVCGAPNVRADICVPFALPGAELPDGKLISKAEIRGVASNGMLCSKKELCLGTESGGIFIMDNDLVPGTKLVDALNVKDWVFDVSVTPNRPDCMSVIGIAREIAANKGLPLVIPEIEIDDTSSEINSLTSVTVESPDLCPRYTARMIRNITIKPSPFWLQERLMSVGQRPINNIVDITNYVMLETGQPLHAFDYDELNEKRIVVKKAGPNHEFVTLDGKKRTIPHDTCMICDGKKAVGIGGVMGGENSEVTAKTTTVLLESACFSPMSIRKTSKTLGLSTDASQRFERGVDPQGTVYALNKAALLMAELGDGELLSGLIDVNPVPHEVHPIDLSIKKTNRLIGSALSKDEIGGILKSIGFKVKVKDDDTFSVTPPSFRVDVSQAADLMEEVARLWGYDNIQVTLPAISLETPRPENEIDMMDRARNIMTGLGFSEVINYSFIEEIAADKLCLNEDDERRAHVPLLNPLSNEQAIMRTSHLPGILDTVKRNISQQEKNIRIFEIGKIFLPREGEKLPYEPEIISAVLCGSLKDASWHENQIPADFYDMKGVLESFLTFMNVSANISYTQVFDENDASYLKKDIFGFTALTTPYTKPGSTALVAAEFDVKKPLGIIGELHPRAAKHFDIKERVYLFEINLSSLYGLINNNHVARSLPKYPSVARDLTLIVDKSIEAEHIMKKIATCEESLVESVSLFAVYEKTPIPEGKISLSFRILYRSEKETLKDDKVTELHKSLSEKIIDFYNAGLPV